MKRKKLFSIWVLFICCFVCMSSVKAEAITCFYSGDVQSQRTTTGNYDNHTFAVGITYNCDTNGRCQASYAAGYTDKNDKSQTVKFANAGSYFGQSATDYRKYFTKGGNLECPETIGVSGGTENKFYFTYECNTGVCKELKKQIVPSGNTLADKVKSVTDTGHYNTNSGNSTPATNPDDDEESNTDNSKYIPGIRDRYSQGDENPYNLNDTNCSELLGSGEGSVAEILKGVFFAISIIGVIILIFTIGSDFIKAIASSDNDALSKSFSSSKTRIIATLILLILPVLVSFTIDLINNNAYVVTDENGNRIEVKIGKPSECKITD